MTPFELIQFFLFVGLLVLSAKPLGIYFKKIFDGNIPKALMPFQKIESGILNLFRVGVGDEQTWSQYAVSLLWFSALSFGFTYLLLKFQTLLPLNPQKFGDIPWHLNLNTTVSFGTNTNWQSYSGESTMSYFSQMVPLTIHNFFSAAVGMSVAVAVVRGIARKENSKIGNFWVDLVRSHLYVLIPFSFIFAVFLLSQGMIQNFLPYHEVTTLEGLIQTIAQGPVASQVAIKMLGTNGGGFFNANAAHPYENPTAVSNFFQMLSIFLIPSGLVYFLGLSVGDKRHGWSVWATMAIVFVVGFLIVFYSEKNGVPKFTELGCNSSSNWEGKETRFGIFNSSLFATVTTDASCGAVNAMHGSFTPLGGLVLTVNMLLGEIIFGGVGSGLYGMVLFIILTVFIAGLMVGRTPEYLGKKIEGREVKYATLAIIVPAVFILALTAVAALYPEALKALGNPNARGLTEIFYAYTSAAANNGSAFAGLSANTPFWNTTLAIAMFFGRFFMMVPLLAIAGSLGAKKTRPQTQGSFPVHGPTFIILLLGVLFIVGALTFMPALSLGPILEHFQMLNNQSF